MRETLTPCKFCGGEATLYADCDMLTAKCKTCNAQIGSWHDEPEDAIRAWNERAPEPEPRLLTAAELRTMVGKWVWVEKTQQSGRIIKGYAMMATPSVAGFFEQELFAEHYGKSWIAYDRQPKESAE